MATPTLHLLPAPLDFGLVTEASAADTIGQEALAVAARLEHWVVENAKTARAVLARFGQVVPPARPLRELDIVQMPRPPKGAGQGGDAARERGAWEALLAPLRRGCDLGLMSEAGLPAVADPGSALVALAHQQGFAVRVHPGPNAIVMALAASGLSGQSFAFAGYAPVDAGSRASRLRDLDRRARRERQTQILIETPYRNRALLRALLENLEPTTRLSVSVGLTLAQGWTRSSPVERWRAGGVELPEDVPAVFCFGVG
jgi:16S rRNA (cytidine1402-2'-O)-methyltransferase